VAYRKLEVRRKKGDLSSIPGGGKGRGERERLRRETVGCFLKNGQKKVTLRKVKGRLTVWKATWEGVKGRAGSGQLCRGWCVFLGLVEEDRKGDSKNTKGGAGKRWLRTNGIHHRG